jgi:hypothetical protein
MMGSANDVAYCGLYCGDCIIRSHRAGASASDLLATMATPEFRKLASGLPILNPELFGPLQDRESCCRILAALSHLDCQAPCREGGGSSQCPIRQCCGRQGIPGCWECAGVESCQTLAWLDPVHKAANLANLRIIRDKGMDAFLAGEKHW